MEKEQEKSEVKEAIEELEKPELKEVLEEQVKSEDKDVLEVKKSVEEQGQLQDMKTVGDLDKLLLPLIFFIGTIVYLETVVHVLIYRSVDSKLIYPILFAIPCGFALTMLTGFFGKKMNRFLLWGFTIVICLISQVQLVYFYVFKVYFSFQSLGLADDAITNFYEDVFHAIWANLGGLLSLFLPIVILAIFINSRIDYQMRKIKRQFILCGGCAFFHMVALFSLLIFGRADYSPYDLYFHSGVPNLCGQQLGMVTMTRLDISGLFSKKEDLVLADTINTGSEDINQPYATLTLIPTPLPDTALPATEEAGKELELAAEPTIVATPTPTPIDTSPNIMNFDFSALADKEKDKTLQTLHRYFATVPPTNKNMYTGRFKGYNLIMITAEGFSPYAVHEAKTPTLYRLIREGFVFNHFYTALWQTSTSDGEYVAMTGLIPLGTRSMYNGRKNLWPFSLGRQFNKLGVESKAYHNHTYTYYQRNETHTNLGYLWKAKGNGLELPSDCWPGSDLEMIDATVDEYTDEDQFHVYYLTVSGHMNYTFTGNSMSNKNKELVKDLPYSDDVRAYIACQMELDKALEQLIKKLNEAGVADRTVIALSADHYPYGWDKTDLDEIAGHTVDPEFEIYKNHFILWCQGMKENIVIDKPCSSLDILPTLSNLFGLEYDSRLLMGQDILSDSEPLVVLSDRSFIADKVMYNAATGESTLLTSEPLPEDYISNLNKVVKNKFSVSKSILEKDYYRVLFEK